MTKIPVRLRKNYIFAHLDYILNDQLAGCVFVTPAFLASKYKECTGNELMDELDEFGLILLDLVEDNYGQEFAVFRADPVGFLRKAHINQQRQPLQQQDGLVSIQASFVKIELPAEPEQNSPNIEDDHSTTSSQQDDHKTPAQICPPAMAHKNQENSQPEIPSALPPLQLNGMHTKCFSESTEWSTVQDSSATLGPNPADQLDDHPFGETQGSPLEQYLLPPSPPFSPPNHFDAACYDRLLHSPPHPFFPPMSHLHSMPFNCPMSPPAMLAAQPEELPTFAAATPQKKILQFTKPDKSPLFTEQDQAALPRPTLPTTQSNETCALVGKEQPTRRILPITQPDPRQKMPDKLAKFVIPQEKKFSVEVYQLFQAITFVPDEGGTLTNAVNLLIGHGTEPFGRELWGCGQDRPLAWWWDLCLILKKKKYFESITEKLKQTNLMTAPIRLSQRGQSWMHKVESGFIQLE